MKKIQYNKPVAKDIPLGILPPSTRLLVDIVYKVGISSNIVDPIIGYIVSSIKGVNKQVEATSIQVIPLSQDSASSQSSLDSQNQVVKVKKNTKATLYQFEVATSI